MKIETVLAKTAHLIAERYTDLVLKIDASADQRSDEAQLKLLGRASMEGCRVGAFHAQGQRMLAGMAKLEAEIAKASIQAAGVPANENDVEAPEEMEMDDDTGRTPERVEALYREIDRRLAALAAERESKARRGGDGHVADGGGEGGPAAGARTAPDGSA